jgi:hypothetical protein
VLAVFLFHEPSDVVDGVAVSLLQAWGWKGHCDDVRGDVSEVQVELFIDCAVLGSGDYLAH